MKNLLLFSTLLLSTTGVFAQLTVKPNGSNDSFIYVNDEVVFVTQEINLARNGTANNREASIYLRNNAQLMQGGTTSTNSGDGQLSVQQITPNTNPWGYYLWCSPVGFTGPVSAPLAAGNTPFGIGQIYEALSTSPTAAQQVATVPTRDGFNSPRLTISTRWLYTHLNPGTEAESNYQRMNSNNAAPAGFGFTMKGVNNGPIANGGIPSNHNQLYEFRGRPNNGDFSVPVQGPAHTGPNSDVNARMTLTGNPYPSALDLNRVFFELGNGALSAFYFYDEDRNVATHYYSAKPYGYGVFLPMVSNPNGDPANPVATSFNPGVYTDAPFYIWNANGGTTGPSGGGTQLLAHRFAPIGQGIMFVGNTGSSTNILIKNSHRRYIKQGATNHSIFHKTDDGDDLNLDFQNDLNDHTFSTSDGTGLDYRIAQTRLYVVFDEAVTRDMLLVFSDEATDGFDRGMDGLSPMNLNTDAFFPIGEDSDRKPYVINGIKFDRNKQVPIAFKIKNQSKLDIKVVEEVKRPYTNAYIYDRVENTYQQINRGMSATFNLPTGTYDNRFFIVFRNPNVKGDISQTVLNGRQMVLDNVSFFQNNPQKQLEISNPEGYVIKSALVYDMNGKLVIQEKNLGDQTKYSFYTGNLSDGVYLVKLMTADDIAIDYKAIVHNK